MATHGMTYEELLNLIKLMEPSELKQKVKVIDLNSESELQIEFLRKSFEPKSKIPKISLDGTKYEDETPWRRP